MIIGLTGTYCAGKNHIAAMLETRGLPVLDVDKIGYQVLDSEKDAIFAKFGLSLKKADGSLDRRLLGQCVFGQPEKLAALENIIHPGVNRLTDEWIAVQKKHCVINAALLHRSSSFHKLDRLIIVTAPYLTRLFRAKRRDKLPWRDIFKRIASQKDFTPQYLAINAEIYKVENSGFQGSKRLERRIDNFVKGIK
jgi:dephospho-CoA kinase